MVVSWVKWLLMREKLMQSATKKVTCDLQMMRVVARKRKQICRS